MEDNRHIILDDISKLTKNKLSEGTEGICYLLDDNNIFKHFRYNHYNDNYMEGLVLLSSPQIAFPTKLVYSSDNILIGYIMPYMKGNNFIEKNVNIKTFISSLNSIEKETKNLTKDHLLKMMDIHGGNIIISPEDTIKLIDVSLWEFDKGNDPYYVYRHNIKELANAFLYEMLTSLHFGAFINDNLENYYLQAVLSGKCLPSYVLFEAVKLMEKELKEEVRTYEEFSEGIKLIRR